uniref:Apple domain-containing protein n=1 Tax=Mesocestoides corti TaxID=53468 RepID=A0A5K3FEG6_MESCO
MLLLLIVICFCRTSFCEVPTCEATLFKNVKISKESLLNGAVRLETTFLGLDECLAKCCGNENCTAVTYYSLTHKCIFYNCGNTSHCTTSDSVKANVYEIVKIAAENATNPFWSRLTNQTKKQKALTISVFVMVSLVLLGGVILFVYLCLRRRQRGQLKPSKRRIRKVRSGGGNYHILFNSEGEEAVANGNNSLF